MAKILIIEAFYGGSHKQLLDTILDDVDTTKYDLFTLPAKKWHWRARASALYFSQVIPDTHQYELIFASSVLNLAELIGMRSDLINCKKIVYFHENQLNYPTRELKDRDCQYGLNELMSCIAADELIFNSNFNKDSFLNSINTVKMPTEMRTPNLREKIERKCKILYFPIKFHEISTQILQRSHSGNVLHIIWPHRWEHDKNPESLAETVFELDHNNIPFKLSILGEQFQAYPPCLDEIRERLKDKIQCYGYLSRGNYIKCLSEGDIVISTASHEFYGVAMLEAIYCGCVPIAPNKLVYPELYPKEFLYNTDKQLVKKLRNWLKNPNLFQQHRNQFFQHFSFQLYSSRNLVPKFLNLLKLKSTSENNYGSS